MSFNPGWDLIHQSVGWGTRPDADFMAFMFKWFSQVPDPSKINILDIGCGTGNNAVILEAKGFNVVALDGSVKALERLRGRGFKGQTINEDICNVIFEPETFDCILDVCTLTVLPFDQAREVIVSVQKWLKPNGHFFSKLATDPYDYDARGIKIRLTSKGELLELFKGFGAEFYGVEQQTRGKNTYHWVAHGWIPGNPQVRIDDTVCIPVVG